MSRLPINPAFDRSANTRRGLRIALAVGLGTLALGLAAGALAASGNPTSRIAHVRHVDSANAMAPSTLRGGDLFTNPTMAPQEDAAPAAAAAAAATAPAGAEAEHAQTMSDDKKSGSPPTSDDHHPPVSSPAKPKPKSSPSPEPSQSPEPTPSPGD